jgi:hypothetical protein
MMKLRSTFSLGALALQLAGAANAAVNVNVIVEGQIKPGVYGRVEVGNPNLPPPVWRPQPVVIAPAPQVVEVVPVYVHVPPGHARNWRKHCHRYDACGQSVYFVKSAEYEPGYGKKRRHRHDDDGSERRGHGGRD